MSLSPVKIPKKALVSKETLEAILIGLGCIALGTIIASSVNASELCSPKATDAPDSSCSLPLKTGPEAKVCLGAHHSRCFEIKEKHLIQSFNGSPVRDRVLDEKSEKQARGAIESYASYLSSGLQKRKNVSFVCKDPVVIEMKLERNGFCLNALPAKEVDAKTNALISSLERIGPAQAPK